MSPYAVISPRRKFALLTFLLGISCAAAAAPADARVSEAYGRLPLHFEANRGQTNRDVRFLSHGPGYDLYLTANEVVLVLTRARPGVGAPAKPVALRMSLVGGAPRPLVSGLEELPGKANYFIGKDPAKWRSNVPTYAKVHYREVYPGIDLLYYGNQRQLEYDFVLAPGADPKKIVLGFKGARRLEIDAQGELVLHTAGGALRHRKPAIYQEIDGVRSEIEGGYVLKGAKRVGFQVAGYDTHRPLIIDPMLAYSTYLGELSNFSGCRIAVDASGNAYVAGPTASGYFPTTPGAFQPSFAGGQYDVFVAKLNPSGSALVYSTYLGGTDGESSSGIAVDAGGNAYVTGSTYSSDFPTTAGALHPSTFPRNFPNYYSLSFVTKLDPTGSALVYSTYLTTYSTPYPPSEDVSRSTAIAVDAGGNAYVTGVAGTDVAGSPEFPTTPGAFQSTYSGNADAFVMKLNPTGSALVYSTFLGGSDADEATGIAVDADGNAYVTGTTNSTNFPTTAGAFQPGINEGLCQAPNTGKMIQCSDVFVTKLDATGSALIYSTFLGGSSPDYGRGIAVDAAGNAYVTGGTDSTNFPTTPGAFQTTYSGPEVTGYADAFVTKLDPAGSALVYSTYLGAISDDRHGVSGIAVDAGGNAYVTGADGFGFPTTPGTPKGSGFVTKLDPTGSALVYSTLLAGDSSHINYSEELANGIAVDGAGSAYLAGLATAYFQTTPGALRTIHSGGQFDPFVAKIVHNRSEESAATYDSDWPSYGPETGRFSGGTAAASNVAGSTASFSFTGTAVSWIGVKCSLCGIASVSIDGGAATTVNTAGPASSNVTSEPVFSASGLAPDVSHTLAITVTGTTTSNGAYVAVDAFDVTR